MEEKEGGAELAKRSRNSSSDEEAEVGIERGRAKMRIPTGSSEEEEDESEVQEFKAKSTGEDSEDDDSDDDDSDDDDDVKSFVRHKDGWDGTPSLEHREGSAKLKALRMALDGCFSVQERVIDVTSLNEKLIELENAEDWEKAAYQFLFADGSNVVDEEVMSVLPWFSGKQVMLLQAIGGNDMWIDPGSWDEKENVFKQAMVGTVTKILKVWDGIGSQEELPLQDMSEMLRGRTLLRKAA
jgi:hypothetical protein